VAFGAHGIRRISRATGSFDVNGPNLVVQEADVADAATARRRWDTDDWFAGVADAAVFAPPVEELAALARRPGWVAEEPGVHLVPHLRGAGVGGLRVVECTAGDDGILDVTAEHPAGDSQRDIRRRAWALIGAVAEPAASVYERRDGDAVVFEVVTGIPEGAGHFATHGHTLRLRIRPAGRP
jgi:hypothetical protein